MKRGDSTSPEVQTRSIRFDGTPNTQKLYFCEEVIPDAEHEAVVLLGARSAEPRRNLHHLPESGAYRATPCCPSRVRKGAGGSAGLPRVSSFGSPPNPDRARETRHSNDRDIEEAGSTLVGGRPCGMFVVDPAVHPRWGNILMDGWVWVNPDGGYLDRDEG